MREVSLPAVQKAYDLAKEVILRCGKYPREHRFTLGERTICLALDVLDALVQAEYSKQKVRHLDAANLDLERLRWQLKLAMEVKALPIKGYQFTTRMADEAGRQVGGWRKQQGGTVGENA